MLIEIIIYFNWIRSSWVRHSYFKSLYYSWLLVRLPRDQHILAGVSSFFPWSITCCYNWLSWL